jgi:hypothetical protein
MLRLTPAPFLESLPATPALALPVVAHGYALQLDPHTTAPYALVGVMFDRRDAATVVLMRPGDVVQRPQGFREMFVFNAMGWLPARMNASSRPRGQFSLLVGDRPGEFIVPPPDARPATYKAGRISLVDCGDGSQPGDTQAANLGFPQAPFVPLHGVRRIRATVIPRLNTNVAPIYPPGDFIANFFGWVMVMLPRGAGGGLDFTQNLPLNPWDDPLADATRTQAVWVPHAAANINATGTECVFEFDVPSGLVCNWQIASATLAGTNVASALLAIEVF